MKDILMLPSKLGEMKVPQFGAQLWRTTIQDNAQHEQAHKTFQTLSRTFLALIEDASWCLLAIHGITL